ncbi:MAG: hypothetical protein ACFFE8_09575 [Candidatus Heimdallarchaeota archaeon]
MAWIPAIAAASAASACHTGQGKKLPKWAVLFIILTMAVGLIIPLGFLVIRSQSSSSLIIMPLVLFCFIMFGVVAMVVVISSEGDEKVSETGIKASYKRRRVQPRKSEYLGDPEPEWHTWSPTNRIRKEHYCSNCGSRLDHEDNFCDQCGWEVRAKSYDRR